MKVVITGGVMSSIGKGIITSSLIRLHEQSNKIVDVCKIDPYLNVDARFLSPHQHGEVFVLPDGTETDMDLGHYYRFSKKIQFDKRNNLTTGQLYKEIINDERSGAYDGKTVQVIPHLIHKLLDKISKFDLLEIGGTVGDYECIPYLEMLNDLKKYHIHVVYCPCLNGDDKTKPIQHSVMILRNYGLKPDCLVVRSKLPISLDTIDKIKRYTKIDNVIGVPDIESIYKVPDILVENNLHKELNLVPDLIDWSLFHLPNKKKFKIGIITKYTRNYDAHRSIHEALLHAGKALCIDVESKNIGVNHNEIFNGYIVAGGFGNRGIEDMINFISNCNKPMLGICLGYQLMVIAHHRKINPKLSSEEFSNDSKDLFYKMGSLRTGLFDNEIYRHRYNLNKLHKEYDSSYKCNGVQYHPEFLSKPLYPHKDFINFLNSL